MVERYLAKVEIGVRFSVSAPDMLGILIKQILVAALLLILYPLVGQSFGNIEQQEILNTLLLFVGLIIVAPMFAYFQFSYGYTKPTQFVLAVSHLTTGLALFVIGILLVMIDVLFLQLIGNVLIFRFTLLVYYISCIGYDVWDYARFQGLAR